MMLYEFLSRKPLSPQHYISGQRALNIYDHVHGTGDWHTVETWLPTSPLARFSLMGKGEEFNTNAYLGAEGVINVTEILQRMGTPQFAPVVWAASHARAIADMVICDALDGKDIRNKKTHLTVTLNDLDDWMPAPEDKMRVYHLLHIAISSLPQQAKAIAQAWVTAAKARDFNE